MNAPTSPQELVNLHALFTPTSPEKPPRAPRRAPAPRIPKAPTKTVTGLTWTKHVSESGRVTWEAIDGHYRPQIWSGLSKRDLLCSVYYLDPKFKALDPTRDRLSQDCLLNQVHPQGRSLDAIMADTVRLIGWHREAHEHEFKGAREISGQDVVVGMLLHFKGVFSTITRLVRLTGKDYRVASFFGDSYPRTVHPGSTYTVYVPES